MLKIWIDALKSGLAVRKAVTAYETLLVEAHKPTLSTAVKWMTASGVIAVVLNGVVSLLYALAGGGHFNDLLLLLIFKVRNTVGLVVLFVISSFIMLRIAQVLGGEGNLDSQSYLLAAVGAPMFIIQDVLRYMLGLIDSLIDIPAGFNTLVFFASIIYTGWLSMLVLRASHKYTGIRAVLSVLIFIASIIAIFRYGLTYLAGLIFS